MTWKVNGWVLVCAVTLVACTDPAGTTDDLSGIDAKDGGLVEVLDAVTWAELARHDEVPFEVAAVEVDAGDQEDGLEEGGFGWPCEDNSDCSSGYCLDLGTEKICPSACIEDCPEGWSCQQIGAALPDMIYVCVPTGIAYCRPCQSDDDCLLGAVDLSSRCVAGEHGESYCGSPCSETSDCQSGAACVSVTTVDGAEVDQCQPETGKCACTEWAVAEGAVTDCTISNEFGMCPGQRACEMPGPPTACNAPVPTAETCNGLDDDCDGDVDEKLGETTCGLGKCEHTVANCVDGVPLECDPLDGAKPDEQCNGEDDDCDGEVDEGFADSDGDGIADCMEDDADNDGIKNYVDNCPFVPNPDQGDNDLDIVGDACDPDDDNDKSPDEEDCEPFNDAVSPNHQESCNGIDDDCSGLVDDGLGESTCGKGECLHTVSNCLAGQVQVCDPFAAAIAEECDGLDNDCDGTADDGFADLDQDGEADCVDADDDGDGVNDAEDNCPVDANQDQLDTDQDGFGDVCDFGCYLQELDEWEEDCDGVPESVDNCPLVANPDQVDTDNDGMGDACDGDDDEDGVPDLADNCPLVSNPNQMDLDEDGTGDACDGDQDGDLIGDEDDNCVLVANKDQADNDKDGMGDACDPDDDNDTDPDTIDCQPFKPNISHLAQEKCNGGDDDCDGGIDEENAEGCSTFYLDIDGDGYGVAKQSKCLCQAAELYLAQDAGDCKPLDEAINPGEEELCNGLDDNCDDVVDEDYPDTDGDGEADCIDDDDDNDGIEDDDDNCVLVANGEQADNDEDGDGDVCDPDDDNDGAADDADCLPFDADVYPGNPELCNGKDSDCNGQVDDGLGETTCGVGACEHTVANCLDGESQECDAEAGKGDEICNGLDDDCDGEVDGGFEVGVFCLVGIGQCQDEGLTACTEDGTGVYCDAEQGDPIDELCNGLDDDCDGEADEELGTTTCGLGECEHTVDNCIGGVVQVCDPLAGAIDEVCDGLDNDCNGEVDNGLGTSTCGVGECLHSVPNCVDGADNACDPLEGAGPELCNGLDDDCDGSQDEGLGSTTCGLGICEHTVVNCENAQTQVCDPLEGADTESCNNLDDDCDGGVDEELTQPCSTVCGSGVKTCVAGQYGECDAQVPVAETCDKQDNDCDGAVDEGFSANCFDITCTGNGIIQTIPDGCIDDGGGSAGGDALQVFCCYGIARFCLSGEACPWRNGCVQTNDTCSRSGLGSDFMANAWCSYYKGHAHYYCNSQKQIYF